MVDFCIDACMIGDGAANGVEVDEDTFVEEVDILGWMVSVSIGCGETMVDDVVDVCCCV